jgi:hypothetical protein
MVEDDENVRIVMQLFGYRKTPLKSLEKLLSNGYLIAALFRELRIRVVTLKWVNGNRCNNTQNIFHHRFRIILKTDTKLPEYSS